MYYSPRGWLSTCSFSKCSTDILYYIFVFDKCNVECSLLYYKVNRFACLQVWRKMRELKLSPDIYSYNLLVQCIKECQAGDPQLTSQLLQETPSPSMTVKGTQKPKINGEHTEEILQIESKKKPSERESKAHIEADRYVKSGENSDSLIEPEYTVIEVKRKMENAQGDQQVLPDLLGRKMTVGNVIGLSSLQQPKDR